MSETTEETFEEACRRQTLYVMQIARTYKFNDPSKIKQSGYSPYNEALKAFSAYEKIIDDLMAEVERLNEVIDGMVEQMERENELQIEEMEGEDY